MSYPSAKARTAFEPGRWEPNAGSRRMVVPSPAFWEGDGHLALPAGGWIGTPPLPTSPLPPLLSPPPSEARWESPVCAACSSPAPSSWSTHSFFSTYSAMTSSYSRIISSHSLAS